MGDSKVETLQTILFFKPQYTFATKHMFLNALAKHYIWKQVHEERERARRGEP